MQQERLFEQHSVPTSSGKPATPLFEPAGSFLVCAPLFPVEAYSRFSTQASESVEALSALPPRARLAIGVGSPSLLEEIERPTVSQRDARRRGPR